MIIRIFAILSSILLIPLLLLTTAAKIGEAAAQNSATAGPGTQQPAQLICHTNPIAIPSIGAATPYPATIHVSGYPTATASVRVHLLDLNHTWPDDVDILLVGPQGQNLILMSDAGGSSAITNVTLIFADEAAEFLPDNTQILSGTVKPTNWPPADTFPGPAPSPSTHTTLDIFAGSDPNGPWNLFIVDDFAANSGNLAGGWCLELTPLPLPQISLSMGVGTDPAICASSDRLTVSAGEEITYCYTVVNEGNVTLDRHHLADTNLGILLDDFPWPVQPGQQFTYTHTAALYATTTSTATWTAYNPGPINSVSASAAVTVTILAPQVGVTPAQLSSTQVEIIAITRTLTISNSGEGMLTWSITIAPDLAWPESYGIKGTPAGNGRNSQITTPPLAYQGCFTPPENEPWLSVMPAAGVILPGEAGSTSATLNAAGLAPGDYHAFICLHSNDPANRVIPIPVVIKVIAAEKTYLPLIIRP